MIVFTPPQGTYGSIAQCLREAEALVAVLQCPERTQALMQEFPQTTQGLCETEGHDGVTVSFDGNGQLTVTAIEGGS